LAVRLSLFEIINSPGVMMLQTIKAFVDTNKQIQPLEPIKFAKKPALVIILNDNETTTGIENILITKTYWSNPAENQAGLQLQPAVTSHRQLEASMIAALKQDAEDQVYQAEIRAWDSVVGDGIDAEICCSTKQKLCTTTVP
jgi:hypothetical protein